jgi:hypothetical protein
VKYYDNAKYEDKVLVWLAMSPAGLSEFYIVPSKMVVNQTVYLEECLIKRLLPFNKNIIKEVNMCFGPIWLPHTMQIWSKNSLLNRKYRLYHKQ